MTAKPDIAQALADISERLARLERNPTPALQRELQQLEFDKIWYGAKAAADEPDASKRAAWLMEQTDLRYCDRFFLHLAQDPQRAIDTVNELPHGDARLRIVRCIPPSLQQDMLVQLLPTPKRVRLTLKPGLTAWRSSSIKGAKPSEDYRGVALIGRGAVTNEPGRCEVVMIEAVFKRACEIDAELTEAIRRGVVVVEEVSEEESRRLLSIEIQQLDPSQRPRLEF